MNKLLPIIFLLLSCSGARKLESIAVPDSPFLVTPYLQIGANPSPDSMMVLWHTIVATDLNATWTVDYKGVTDSVWKQTELPFKTKLTIRDLDAFFVYRARLTDLEPGGMFAYRIMKNDNQVFTAEGKALKSFTQPYRFIATGDLGAGSINSKLIAKRMYKSNPDLVAIAGDIVYDYGLISEYTTKFWPIYNADKINMVGVPLMCSIPFFAAVGNHDTELRNMNLQSDALAYFHFWDQPLNGPLGVEGGPFVPVLIASNKSHSSFLEGTGNRYPRMTNYSFNYGNAHWTVLDANTYVDWTNEEIQDWVKKDLASASAQDATWRFVMYHHPGFNSSHRHYEQQHMRLLFPLFDSAKVDIVFNGHVHNYQRTFPMKYKPERTGNDKRIIRGIDGSWTLDKWFDGKTNTKPNGVIYIVTGAGGQALYNPEQQIDPGSWQEFTDKFISTIHSFSVVDIDGGKLRFSQIGVDGAELDSFEINKEVN